MAERIVSPGVFTQENDLSFLPQGIAAIGAAVIGPTEKGPAFIPTVIETQNDFLNQFGTGTYYTQYAVQQYLKSAGRVTIVRVLGQGGYTKEMASINISGSTFNLFGSVLALTRKGIDDGYAFGSASINDVGTVNAFTLTLKAGEVYSASFNPALTNYITKILGTDPKTNTRSAYVYLNFGTYQSESSTGTAVAFGTSGSLTFGSYDNGQTPFLTSQTIGNKNYDLFKVHTLSHGNASNTQVKVGIFDVKFANEVPNSDYGTFGLVVRKYGDTDSRPENLETFNGLTFDPDSPNYVLKAIGNRYGSYDSNGKLIFTGDYANRSKYVRLEAATDLETLPKSVVPFGFKAYVVPHTSPTSAPTMSYVQAQTINGETNTRAYQGFDFTREDDLQYLSPVPSSGATTGSNTAFQLADFLSGATGSLANRKFILGFQKGFDGFDPSTLINQAGDITAGNTQGFDCTNANSSGTVDYRKAIDAISNPDEIDINMVVLPGILQKLHSSVTSYMINTCEDRADCFYIMDSAEYTDTITQATANVETLDTNYASTYYPWVKIVDPNTNKPKWVPPSIVMIGVYSFSDQVGEEWFAPAGLNRGGIPAVVEAYTRLTREERDDLYEGRVNPLATFPGIGVAAWGQKTLQARASALDRVNVRRLLIALKKFIASSSRFLVFEQNVSATRNRFLNIVNPYLESVQQRAGLFAFRVVMDETNNTPDVIDRNQLKGAIYLQPARTAEFIILDFNILPTGATFDF